MAAGILGQEYQDAGLPAAAHGDVVPLDNRVLSVIGHRMKVQVEGLSGKEFCAVDLIVPGGQKARRLAVLDAGGILREVAFLGEGVQAGKQRQALIGHQGHDMALTLDRPELEGQTSPQGVLGRDHLGAGQARGACQLLGSQAHQIGDEQEKPPTTGGELARRQGELAHVSHRFNRGGWQVGPFLVQAPG